MTVDFRAWARVFFVKKWGKRYLDHYLEILGARHEDEATYKGKEGLTMNHVPNEDEPDEKARETPVKDLDEKAEAFQPAFTQAFLSNGQIHEYAMTELVQKGLIWLGETVAKNFEMNDPTHNSGARFENETFSMVAYCWCDGERAEHVNGCPPNFKCGDFEASWYKYLGRGSSMNKPITKDEFEVILRRCFESLGLV